MGHALMDKVMLHWADLPGNSYKILMVMAKTGMDTDLVPVYFGGWERLAMTGLGRHDWPADDDDSDAAERVRRAGFEIVRKALAQAKQAGAIKVKRQGKRGNVAHYSLHLDAKNLWKTPVLPTESVRGSATKACVVRTESVRTTHGKEGVEETKRKPKEQGEEISSSPADGSPAREATSANPKSARLQLVRERADAQAGTAS